MRLRVANLPGYQVVARFIKHGFHCWFNWSALPSARCRRRRQAAGAGTGRLDCASGVTVAVTFTLWLPSLPKRLL